MCLCRYVGRRGVVGTSLLNEVQPFKSQSYRPVEKTTLFPVLSVQNSTPMDRSGPRWFKYIPKDQKNDEFMKVRDPDGIHSVSFHRVTPVLGDLSRVLGRKVKVETTVVRHTRTCTVRGTKSKK